MMPMTNHPITPPTELVRHWIECCDPETMEVMIEEVVRWGADMELEACVDVLGGQWEWDVLSQCVSWKEFRDQSEEILRAARRPKPPTLKEQALKELKDWTDEKHGPGGEVHLCEGLSVAILRRALEQLDD